MCRGIEAQTTVTEDNSVSVPARVRDEADIEAGDRFRWRVDESGQLAVDVVDERFGAFSELDPIEGVEQTDAAEDHDVVREED